MQPFVGVPVYVAMLEYLESRTGRLEEIARYVGLGHDSEFVEAGHLSNGREDLPVTKETRRLQSGGVLCGRPLVGHWKIEREPLCACGRREHRDEGLDKLI